MPCGEWVNRVFVMNKPVEQYWQDDDCYLVFFGDIATDESGVTKAREAEYHADTGDVVVVDVYWDKDDDMVDCASINPETLEYNTNAGCVVEDSPNISRAEYDELTDYVRNAALKSLEAN